MALLLSSPAVSGPMMPPGPSPEAGFAGVWRVIAAKPAPWREPHRLTRQDAPLLEYAIDFVDHEVKGPAPLSCNSAKYSSGVTYQSDAFAGKLADDKDGTRTKNIGLTGLQFTTYRVYCGDIVRDYYFDNNADLLMAVGDVIYTLERPTGMDPQQYTAGYSGPSFDCAEAKTTGERLICRDAGLSQIDRKLNESYLALKKSEAPQSFASFQAAQRAWLAYETKSCRVAGPMPETAGDRNVIIDCLTPDYSDRADLLGGLKVAKAGTLVLEPRIRFRTRAKPHIEESDIYPWMKGGPQAAAFNAFIGKTLALDRWRMDDKDMFPLGDDVGEMRLYARRFYTVAHFDRRVVSLQVSTSDFSGGNHSATDQRALTWDLAKRRLVTLDDVFAKNQDWKPFVTALCKKDLHAQFSDRQAPDLDDAATASTVAASSAWLWGDDKATVVFMVDLIGGMPGGEFDVEILYSTLRPYMKPDAPVP